MVNRARESTLLKQATAQLKSAGVENPQRDARLLLKHAEGNGRRFLAFIARRAKREPVSRILGTRGFWTLDLALSPDTLDPRPDSETLVEAVLAHVADKTRALRLLDLGAGTGCLLLALLSELKHASGVGVDVAPGAVATARVNAEAAVLAGRARFAIVDWTRSDWAAGIGERFDIAVANPPYIPSGDIAGLEPEVARFDPRCALDGGKDGLDAYRAILAGLPSLLASHALAAFEIGHGQVKSVAGLLKDAGLQVLETRRDLAGVERCILATAG